ncbi:hypothetical protein MUGA111182_02890 [Mucilaginibacter galii]
MACGCTSSFIQKKKYQEENLRLRSVATQGCTLTKAFATRNIPDAAENKMEQQCFVW